jgi:hypothetical protein
METRQLKKRRQYRRISRLVGALGSLVAGKVLLINLVALVLDPNSTIKYNGEPTTAVGVTIFATLFVFAFFAAGLGLFFAPSRFLGRQFVLQRRRGCGGWGQNNPRPAF